MAKLLKGKDVASSMKEKMKEDIGELAKDNKVPTLGIIRLGENPGDISYEKSLIKNCEKLGINVEVFKDDRDIETDKMIGIVEKLNEDDEISGILIFRPLPKHIDDDAITKAINPDKDVDCMNPVNLGKIFEGDMSGFVPGTPKAAMEILKYYDIPLEGSDVVVINRSMVVGKPLAMMLLEENATVTICHSRTKDLDVKTKNADVVITALGSPKFFDEKYFNEDSVVIDVGVSRDEGGKLSGDVDFDKVSPLVAKITPVPGGVGSVTTSILLSHVVLGCKNR